MAYGVKRHRFNVDNLETMVATGILDEGAKIELIDGEIFDMGPHGDAHVSCTMRLNRLCSAFTVDELWLGVHNTLP
jgi:hypothetical protein